MDYRRTYESPMDWEYQDQGPMDPSSPFAHSARQSQQKQKNSFASSNFSSFGQRPNQTPSLFQRTNSTPSKPLPSTPGPTAANAGASIFASNNFQRTATAPPFRNPAFTTPRKAFDADIMSEVEDSPAATDASDFVETPDRDNIEGFGRMTVTPGSVHNRSHIKKVSGKGEIAQTIFATRDKVRKRRRTNGERDISGYRLPYRYSEENDDTEYDSDDSTAPHGRSSSKPVSAVSKRNKGFFGHLFSMIQKHPHVPQILGFWLTFVFHLVVLSITFSIMWMVWSGLREDFFAARRAARDAIVNEMDKCRSDYMENKCAPKEQRLPAMFQLCEQWFECFNQDPNQIKNIQIGAKGIVEILNEIVDAMHWKTMIAFIALAGMFFFSGRSLITNTADYANFAAPAPAPRPYASHPATMGHPMVMSPQGIAWEQIPQTPRHMHSRHHLINDETPESDASPAPYKALPAPQTPSSRRSPIKGDRGRSPTKSRSPTKRYRD